MRYRSPKMQRTYRDRRALVADFLNANPVCQRCGFARSDDCHEVKSRARGGSILNEGNLVALCRVCHEWITAHPRQAEAENLSVHSWDDEPDGAA